MRDDVYDTTFELEGRHWWYRARRAIVLDTAKAWLPTGTGTPRILDYGCGTGLNLVALGQLGDAYGLEPHPRAVALARSRGVRVEPMAEAATEHPFGGDFDLICMLDVLEHVEDDAAALVRLRSWLRPGGRLLLTVPAYPWMWSDEDDVSHHLRRYTRPRLRRAIEAAGLSPCKLSHFNATLMGPQAVVAATQRLVGRWRPRELHSNLGPLPSVLNEALRRILATEVPILRRVDLPVGSSIVCVAER